MGDDVASLMLTFKNGAHGVIQASALAYEETPFGQTHHMEFHGSEGTLYHFIDWDKTQRVSGSRQGEGPVRSLEVPKSYWQGIRRDTVHNTYRDIFRKQNTMSREFVSAIAEDRRLRPNFSDGAYIQLLVESAIESHESGKRIKLSDKSHVRIEEEKTLL